MSQDVKETDVEGTTNIDQPDENALALAFQAGDEAAFEELVRRSQGRVYAVAYRITVNREDALDVVQDVFVKAHKKIDMWRPTGNFMPWLLRMASNQSIDHLRRRKCRHHDSLEVAFPAGVDQVPSRSASMDTATRVSANEIDKRVGEAMVKLSPAQRTAFMLRHYEGLPLAEIAPVIGCTVGSVKVHLFRAMRKLRKELSDLYGPGDNE